MIPVCILEPIETVYIQALLQTFYTVICPGCGDTYSVLPTDVNGDWKNTKHFQINSSSSSGAHCIRHHPKLDWEQP